jgi:hypothetical protein
MAIRALLKSVTKHVTPFTDRQRELYLKQIHHNGGAVVEALRYKPEGRGIDS